MTDEQHDHLENWIRNNIIPIMNSNKKYDTSHIRMSYQNRTASTYEGAKYISNDDVNYVMIELGYRYDLNISNDPYLHFNISSQSPAFRKDL